MVNPNVKAVQRQIRNFNKVYSRALNKDILSPKGLAMVTDLIDYNRTTEAGFGKAGTKYLSSLSNEELLSYSSDIEDAYDIIRWEREMTDFELSASDPESLLWKMFDMLELNKVNFNSEDVQDVIDGNTEVGYKEMASKMYRILKDKSYGMADFKEWFEEKRGLSE